MKNLKLKIDFNAVLKVAARWIACAVVAFVSSKISGTSFVAELMILTAATLSFSLYDAVKTTSCDCAECVCDPKADTKDF